MDAISRTGKFALAMYAAAGLAGCGLLPTQPTTIWTFMGIPQTRNMIFDNRVNKNGNHPEKERQLPLKRIADPENLASPNPAIKKAAEIKAAEDLKCQKLKAIKYLASIGCGCYNKDGGVTDALLAAMDDCTEEVRLAAVQAIATSANADACPHCGQHSCCSEKITKQLAKMATETDETGCWFEPSERVRESARDAMCICCPGQEGYHEELGPITPLPEPAKIPAPPLPKEAPMETPAEAPKEPAPETADANSSDLPYLTASGRLTESSGAAVAQADGTDESDAPGFAHVSQSEPVAERPVARQVAVRTPAPVARPVQAPQPPVAVVRPTPVETLQADEVRAERAAIAAQANGERGVVQYVDTTNGTARVHFASDIALPQGTKLLVYHRYVLGRITSVGELEVVDSSAGSATVRGAGQFKISKIASGDEVVVTSSNI